MPGIVDLHGRWETSVLVRRPELKMVCALLIPVINAFNATLRQSNIGNVIIYPVLDPNSADLNQTGGTVTITFGTPRYFSSAFRLTHYSAAASARLSYYKADGTYIYGSHRCRHCATEWHPVPNQRTGHYQLVWHINGPGALQFTSYCPGTVPTATPPSTPHPRLRLLRRMSSMVSSRESITGENRKLPTVRSSLKIPTSTRSLSNILTIWQPTRELLWVLMGRVPTMARMDPPSEAASSACTRRVCLE